MCVHVDVLRLINFFTFAVFLHTRFVFITNATRVVVALLADSHDRFYVAFLDFSLGPIVFFEEK